MKIRKLKGIIAVIICTVITTTGALGCSEKKEEKQSDNVKTEEKQDEEKKEEVVDYKAIYKDEMNNLINKFGKYEDPGNGLPIKGVKYAELIDFDKDKTPEMVAVHDMKVLLYKVKNKKAECIYEGKLGSRFGQTDVSTTLGINTKSEKPSLIVYHSTSEWKEERISIITVENDKVVTKELYAKTNKDLNMPDRKELSEFFIDNESKTGDEYNAIYNSTVKEAKQIDVCWNQEPATKNQLEKFISSL